MLPKKHRLTSGEDFQQVYQKRDSFASKYLVLYLYKREDDGATRIGYSLSKKIGKAHVRNLYKRRLREITRTLLPHIPKGYDMILLARVPITELDFQLLQKNVRYILKKSGVWQDEGVA